MGLLLAGAGGVAAAGDPFPVKDTPAVRERLTNSVAHVLSLSDEQVRAMVPAESGGIYFTSCPNCSYGAEEAGCFNTTWDPREPLRLRCRGCNATYPGNPRYPDDRFIEVDAPGGRKHRFHYYERADGYRFWLRAHAQYLAREYLEAKAGDLGDLYRLTGEDRCARRAAVILHRFAEVFPGYAYKFDYPFKQKLFVPWTQNRIPGVPGDYRTSRWTWWAYMDISKDLLRAHYGLKDWPGWRGFGDGRARERIEKDLFTPMVEFVLGFRDDGTNMSMTVWRSAILAGRVLGRPEWVHESVRRFERVVATKFLYDGHWMETADSYAQMTQGGLQVVMEAAAGYSDSPGYRDPSTGRRFDDLDLRKLVPGYDVAEQAVGAVRLPDNRLIPVNDTWAAHGKVCTWRRGTPRTGMEPALLPATGLAVLGGGEADRQIHAYLNYTMGIHHKHYDALSIGLWAHGYELLSDLGYTWTNYRLHWATTTMAHNTVAVNGVDSGRDLLHSQFRLRAFVADPLGFQLASADAPDAYPKVTSVYWRTLALVGADSQSAYLIDVFQVEGGRQHDYLLHGCRDADSTATVTGAELRPYAGSLINPGIEFSLPQSFQHPNPPGFGFGFIRDLRSGVAGENTILEMRLKERPEVGVRTLIAGQPASTLFLGKAPDVRRAREINGDLEKTTAPVFCLRRQGEELRSLFVAAHEAVRGAPRVRGLTVARSGQALLARVDMGEAGSDYFVMALADRAAAEFKTPHGVLRFDGRYALTRLDVRGRATQAWLAGGKSLALGALTLRGRGQWSGTVLRHQRDGTGGSFDVDQPIDERAAGPFMLRFADGSVWPFNVLSVERTATGSRIRVRETPVFEIGGGKTRLTAFPQREIQGEGLAFELMEVVRHESK